MPRSGVRKASPSILGGSGRFSVGVPDGNETARPDPTTLAVLSILGLIAVSLLVLRPFLAATVWAATLVVATWPLMLTAAVRAFGGRRGPAAAVMTLVLLFLVLLPLSMAIGAIVSKAGLLLDLPEQICRSYTSAAGMAVRYSSGRVARSRESGRAWQKAAPETSFSWFVPMSCPSRIGFSRPPEALPRAVLHLFLTIGIAAILYAKGEMAAAWCRRFGRRLADERGEEVVVLAGRAIRGVALGVVLTALAQTLATRHCPDCGGHAAGGTSDGHCPASVPCADRPILVVLPAIIWLFATGQTVPGIILVVIGVPAVLMDNFLRPVLIRRGADLPLLLIILGVIGGLLAFGVLGLFLGPVILAVTYTLLQHWVAEAKD